MLPPQIDQSLKQFQKENAVRTRGSLSAAVTLTRIFKSKQFPLSSDEFITENSGQVKGLGGSIVKSILSEYGITKTLAHEGGRTSRGTLGLMDKYIAFLNPLQPTVDILNDIEKWWIDRIEEYFSAKPYKLNLDNSKSLKQAIAHLVDLAERRQRENPGIKYVGALYQHLVAAKLQIALKDINIDVFGSSVSDEQNNRQADFSVNDSAIHVTTSPTEALIGKCRNNIHAGFKPLIITNKDGAVTAEVLSDTAGIKDQVEIILIDQFLITNMHEWACFDSSRRRQTMESLIAKYNVIIDKAEGDPSMRIEM